MWHENPRPTVCLLLPNSNREMIGQPRLCHEWPEQQQIIDFYWNEGVCLSVSLRHRLLTAKLWTTVETCDQLVLQPLWRIVIEIIYVRHVNSLLRHLAKMSSSIRVSLSRNGFDPLQMKNIAIAGTGDDWCKGFHDGSTPQFIFG